MSSKEAILFHALDAAQAELRGQAKLVKSQAKALHDAEKWSEALNAANAKFLSERDLAKVDMRDAEEACAAAEEQLAQLRQELDDRGHSAEDKLAKVKDAVYGHHEYSTILWKIRQIVGPE